MIKQGGVYQIVNTENGKRYIGSAKCFKHRWGTHLRHLVQGKHHSQYLQRAWNWHGQDVFKFEVLLLCAPEDAIFYEQRAMDFYKSANHKKGYNVAPAAGGQLGFRHSDLSKLNMSITRTGSKRTDEQRKVQSAAQRSRPDVQTYHFDGRDQTMLQWAEELGWIKDVLARRVNEMGVEKAFTQPHRLVNPEYRRTAEYNGEQRTLVSLAEEFGLEYGVLKTRVDRGWTLEAALNTPLGGGFENRRSTTSHKRKNATKYEHDGKSMSITEWAKHLGISKDTLAYRIRVMKWDLQRALTVTPGPQGGHK